MVWSVFCLLAKVLLCVKSHSLGNLLSLYLCKTVMIFSFNGEVDEMIKRIGYWLVLVFPVFLFGCASGSHVITGQQRPEIEVDQVSVFTEIPTFEFEVIGTVRASSDNGFSEDSRKEKATQELKEQAAKIGANGVIVGDVTQLSFRRLGTGVGVSVGSGGGVGTSIGSSFSFPTTEVIGKAIYYPSDGLKTP